MSATAKLLPEPACGRLTAYSAVVFEGAMFVFGGTNGEKNNELWKCDLSTYSWSLVQPSSNPPPPHAMHAAVVHGRSMYVFGSLSDAGSGMGNVYIFHFDSASWETVTRDSSWPSPRACITAAVIEDRMYAYSGFTGFKDGVSYSAPDLWSFDFNSRKWRCEWKWEGESEGPAWLWPAANGPRPRHAHSTAAWGKHLAVYGGDFGMGHDSDELWLFDSESRTWAQLKDTRTGSGGSDAHTAQPGPRYFHSAVVDAERGSMLLAGRFAKRCVYEAGELRELAYDSEASGSDNVPLWEWDFGAKQWALHTAQLEGQEGLGGLSGDRKNVV